MPITNQQIQRFQKYFQIIEEIHTIESGKVNFTDEKLQNFLDGTTSWSTTFAKTSRNWYRCRQRQSYGFTIAFSNNSIRELKTADQLNEFIQNDMEYELLKGYFNHYIEYFNLNTTVNIEPIGTKNEIRNTSWISALHFKTKIRNQHRRCLLINSK